MLSLRLPSETVLPCPVCGLGTTKTEGESPSILCSWERPRSPQVVAAAVAAGVLRATVWFSPRPPVEARPGVLPPHSRPRFFLPKAPTVSSQTWPVCHTSPAASCSVARRRAPAAHAGSPTPEPSLPPGRKLAPGPATRDEREASGGGRGNAGGAWAVLAPTWLSGGPLARG